MAVSVRGAIRPGGKGGGGGGFLPGEPGGLAGGDQAGGVLPESFKLGIRPGFDPIADAQEAGEGKRGQGEAGDKLRKARRTGEVARGCVQAAQEGAQEGDFRVAAGGVIGKVDRIERAGIKPVFAGAAAAA